jgi:hypothetical protein
VAYACNATWEAKIRRIMVQGQPRKIVCETPFQRIVVCSAVCLPSQDMLEAEIGRTAV